MIPLPRTVLLAGAGLLGVIYLIGASQTGSSSGEPKPCTFHVTADVLNVRSGPNAGEDRVDSLQQGEEVAATPNVIGGFRALDDARWAAAEFLAPMPGSTCDP
ncbi:SH3 domain-containing protein [Saccharopolyspora soli]|uniref:SH3 domain-containing protein n=1 Tax=Saccharopolyspora soli TaxID=2926618 RepID=UPI001F593295|nr:SH3 domain-containing protein [Saccharopolyspora soli]